MGFALIADRRFFTAHTTRLWLLSPSAAALSIDNSCNSLRLRWSGARLTNQEQDADSGDDGHDTGNQEDGTIGGAVDNHTDGEGKGGTNHAGGETAQAGHRGNHVLGQQVGRQREAHGRPACKSPQSQADQRQCGIRTVHGGGGNSGQHGQATEDTYPQAGADNGETAADAISGDEAACEVAEVRGYKWHPGKESDTLQTEAARAAEILRQPENVEPSDWISEGAAQHNAPHVAVGGEMEPALDAALGGNGRRVLTGTDVGHLRRRDAGMGIDGVIDAQPQCEP